MVAELIHSKILVLEVVLRHILIKSQFVGLSMEFMELVVGQMLEI